jgi:hypothetical protein
MDTRKVLELLVAVLAVELAIHGARAAWPAPEALWDFGSFWLSGATWRATGDPYSGALFGALIDRAGLTSAFPNLNPPLWLVVFGPLSVLPAHTAYAALVAASVAIWIAAVAVTTRREGAPALLVASWALATSATWFTWGLGQVYFLLLVPVVAA